MSKIINIDNTTQSLSGNVTIKVKQGKKILKKINIHNTATLNLLYEMLLSLSGKIDQDRLPRYLGVGTGSYSGDSGKEYKLEDLISEVTLTRTLITPNYKGAPKINDTAGFADVIYQGIVPYSDLGVSSGIREIGLFGTQQGHSLLARVQLEEDEILSVDLGQALIIEWKFKIQNAS